MTTTNNKNTLEAVVIKTNGKVEQKTILKAVESEALQGLVGGLLEIVAKVGFDDRYAVLIGNEEAKCGEGLPINMAGTLWMNAHGMEQIIHGDLVVVGEKPKSEGEICDYPEAAFNQIPKLWEEPKIEVFTADSFDELMEIMNNNNNEGKNK